MLPASTGISVCLEFSDLYQRLFGHRCDQWVISLVGVCIIQEIRIRATIQ